jgi:hypothetical protein
MFASTNKQIGLGGSTKRRAANNFAEIRDMPPDPRPRKKFQ